MFYKCKGAIANFRKDENGNFAMIFALSIFVFFGTVGFAIDVTRALHAQSALQNTIDKAVLSLAKDMSKDPSLQGSAGAAQREEYIEKWLNANQAVRQLTMTFSTIIGAQKEITINAEATIPTSLMAIVGKTEMTINATSQAVASSGKAEVMMVLDTTGSMEGSKLTDLKAAATDFTQSLFNQPDATDNLKIGVVPFANYVNVGTEYASEPWLNKPDDVTDTWSYDTFCQHINLQNECHWIHESCSDDDSETGCWESADEEWCPNGGAPQSQCDWWAAHSTTSWEGCVKPREDSYRTNDAFPNSGDSSKYEGKLGWCGVTKMLPLSTTQSDVESTIDALWAYGNTDIAIGLSWGWHLISNNAPFTEGAPYLDDEWQKFIVLMTDGQNTAYSDGDSKMAEVCTNIKNAGIKIFTIAFEITNETVKDRVKDCASEDSYYYDASSSTGVSLQSAFASVSDTISNLRISK